MEAPSNHPAYARDGGQPRYHRGPPVPSSSSFDRASSSSEHRRRGGPVFSSSYEVPPSPITTAGGVGGGPGATPPPMSISADESEDYGLDDLFSGRQQGQGGQRDARDYHRSRQEYDHRRARAEYDHRRAAAEQQQHHPGYDRAPPGGSVFRGYEGGPRDYRREQQHGGSRYHDGYDAYDRGGYGDPRDRHHSHRPPHPHMTPHPADYRRHHPPTPHWTTPGGGDGMRGHAETPPPRMSDGRSEEDGGPPLPAAVSPPDRAGARSGDSVGSGMSPVPHPSASSPGMKVEGPKSADGGGDAAPADPVSPPPLPPSARLAGHRRMPCRARSVPVGHTPQTAYLSIPPDAPHGMVLVCSHPECAASGKRFRFCAVCDIPVAKRNFLKRHSHGLVSPGSPAAQVGQPGAITKEEAVAMARSLGTDGPPSSAASASGKSDPASPNTGASSSNGAEEEDDDGDDDGPEEEEVAAATATAAAAALPEGDGEDKEAEPKDRADGEHEDDRMGVDVRLHRPIARPLSPSSRGSSAAPPHQSVLSPTSPLSTASAVRPRSDSDGSGRSAFGSPVKRSREGGTTPPKNRLCPPKSIDLSIPRMHHVNGAGGGEGGGDGVNGGANVRGQSTRSSPIVPPTTAPQSPRPLSPPPIQACRTFPVAPPHRDPRTAPRPPPEAYYARGGEGWPVPEPRPEVDDDGQPLVAGVSPHTRPGAALGFDSFGEGGGSASAASGEIGGRYRERHPSFRSSGRSSAPPVPRDDSRRSSIAASESMDDISLNRNDSGGAAGGGGGGALPYRRSSSVRSDQLPPPHQRIRARLRAREMSGGSSRRSSTSERARSTPALDDFVPPAPQTSVVRLNRREREWLELLRRKPSMAEVDELEDWMDRVLDISDGSPQPQGSPMEGSGEGNSSERLLDEVVRIANPRPLNVDAPPNEDEEGGEDEENDAADPKSAGLADHKMGVRLPMSRIEPPLNSEQLMQATAHAKRNLQFRAAARTNTGLVPPDDAERHQQEESRTDLDAMDNSLSGDEKESGGTRRRGAARDVPTPPLPPPPMCFAEGPPRSLAGLFGCGAFLCADVMVPAMAGGRLSGGEGPCGPCGANTASDDSRATTPVLEMPAPIPVTKRNHSKGSAGSVSITGSSMVDMLEGTGLMETPRSTKETTVGTVGGDDSGLQFLMNDPMMDSPFPQSMAMPGGSVSSASPLGDLEMKDVENDAARDGREKGRNDREKEGPLSPHSRRGKHRLPTAPPVPTLHTNREAKVTGEFRVGNVNISLNKSHDAEDEDGTGEGEQDVETELKEEQEETKEKIEQEGGSKVKQEESAETEQ